MPRPLGERAPVYHSYSQGLEYGLCTPETPTLVPPFQSHRKSLGSSEGEGESRSGSGKYCCVYLPDGTASLALARPGLSIRAMLAGICEKRGLSLPDIKVYLVGNEQVRHPAQYPLPAQAVHGLCPLKPCPIVPSPALPAP